MTEREEHGGADYWIIKDLLASIAGEEEPAVSLREALRMTLPGIYALASAHSGGGLTKIRYPWG